MLQVSEKLHPFENLCLHDVEKIDVESQRQPDKNISLAFNWNQALRVWLLIDAICIHYLTETHHCGSPPLPI